MDAVNLEGFVNVSEVARRSGFSRTWVRAAIETLRVAPIRLPGPSGRSTITLLSPKDAGRVVRHLERKRKRAEKRKSVAGEDRPCSRY